jgi:hypothetical protein
VLKAQDIVIYCLTIIVLVLFFSAAGVVRDLEYSVSLVRGSSELLRSTLTAALDSASLSTSRKQSDPPPPKPTGAINCCGPGDGTRTGGMLQSAPPTKQPPVTITGVAPWAQPAGWKPGKGLDRVAGVGPLGLPRGPKGGFTSGGGAGGAGKPMTVAPWAQAPGSSIGAALAKVTTSKSATAHSSSILCGTGGGCSAQIDGAVAACAFVCDLLAAEECSSIAALMEGDAVSMQSVAATAHHLVERLCTIGR